MRSSLLIFIGIAAAACSSDGSRSEKAARTSSEQPSTAGGERAGTAADEMAENCPMHVEGTVVQAENAAGGAALVFVTTGDVEELRKRVRTMAAMQESQGLREHTHGKPRDPAAGAKIGDPDNGVSAGGMPQSMMPVDVDTTVEDIEGGARLVMTATDPSDVDALRMHAQQHAERMSMRDECPMMSSTQDATNGQ